MFIRNFVKEKFLPNDIKSDDEFVKFHRSYKQCDTQREN